MTSGNHSRIQLFQLFQLFLPLDSAKDEGKFFGIQVFLSQRILLLDRTIHKPSSQTKPNQLATSDDHGIRFIHGTNLEDYTTSTGRFTMQSQFFSQRGILGARTGVPEGSEREVKIYVHSYQGRGPETPETFSNWWDAFWNWATSSSKCCSFIKLMSSTRYNLDSAIISTCYLPFQSILPPKTPSLQPSPQTKLTYEKYSKQYTQIHLLISKKKQPPTETNYYVDSKLCIWSATPLQLQMPPHHNAARAVTWVKVKRKFTEVVLIQDLRVS